MKESDIRKQYFNNAKIANVIRRQRILQTGRPPVCYSNPLTNFDMDVADALFTIFVNLRFPAFMRSSDNFKFINLYSRDFKPLSLTTADILHVLSGNFSQLLTKDIRQAIEDSIERMCQTEIEIDLIPIESPADNSDEKPKPRPELRLFPMSEPEGNGTDAESKNYSVCRREPFLKLEGENGCYVIDLGRNNTPAVEWFFLPLYAFAAKYAMSQMIAFDPILLSYERRRKEGELRENGEKEQTVARKDRRTVQYIQIRRLLIRRIEWGRFHQLGRIYGDRNITRLQTGQIISDPKDVHYGDTRNIGRARIVYQYKSYSEGESGKQQGESGLLPQLGIFSGDYENRSVWRHRKLSVHRDVCRILYSLQELRYIRGYREILIPAPYRKGGKEAQIPYYRTEKTRLEVKRKSKELSFEQFCKKTLDASTEGRLESSVRRLQKYEWRQEEAIWTEEEWRHYWTEEEWQRFAKVLRCSVEDIKEPVKPTRLETARLAEGWSAERLSEELVLYEYMREEGEDIKDFRSASKDYRRTDGQPLGEWLEILGEEWTERYEEHLEFIRAEEYRKGVPKQQTKEERDRREHEWELLTDVLSGDHKAGEEGYFFPEDLKDRSPNMSLYGVEIYGLVNKSQWTKILRELKP